MRAIVKHGNEFSLLVQCLALILVEGMILLAFFSKRSLEVSMSILLLIRPTSMVLGAIIQVHKLFLFFFQDTRSEKITT